MVAYVKLCPQCGGERPAEEAFCEGEQLGTSCNWPLANESVRVAGRTHDTPTDEPTRVSTLSCPHGHPVEPGDQVCLQCGADLAPDGIAAIEEPLPSDIGGWTIIGRSLSTSSAWEQFIAEQADRRGILTLYAPQAEPDPAVHETLRRMDRDHIPELYATGRWNGRAFEVTEAIGGTTLRDASGIDYKEPSVFRHVVQELAGALAGFAKLGLRHRDLNPSNVLVRTTEPLDLVISGFGSARLSDFDLESVAPLELTRYSSPEAIVGGVAAASDWWSLGVILLERLTNGACFDGINEKAFHIHVVTRGITVPTALGNDSRLLLRGLLARDPLRRWQWTEVSGWLNGEPVEAPDDFEGNTERTTGPALALGETQYRRPETYALAAAEAGNWAAARELFLRGTLASWLEDLRVDPQVVANVRRVFADSELSEDFRHSVALMALSRSLPLIVAGEIVTPAWLLTHPAEGYEVVTGGLSGYLERMNREPWIVRLRTRATNVRERAHALEIELDDERVRTVILATSRTNLDIERAALRRVYPDSEHLGLASLIDREQLSDDDLIVLISAAPQQFTPLATLLDAANEQAQQLGVALDKNVAVALLIRSRREIYAQVESRTSGFARCSVPRINEWADSFRVERRIPLSRAAVLLALPGSDWVQPPKQEYVAALLQHFEKRVVSSIQRGPLVRFTIGKTTARVDLTELNTAMRPADAVLDHLLSRDDVPRTFDPEAFSERDELLSRMRRLVSHALTFKRDTGIDGRYLGFPFLVIRDPRLVSKDSKPRIAPVLLWPLSIELKAGSHGEGALAFDRGREDVRLNPALEGLVGAQALGLWRDALTEVLSRRTLKAADVIDVFGTLAPPSERTLRPLPKDTTTLARGGSSLVCAAVLFNAEFSGQAISEDLRQLARVPPAGTGLQAALQIDSAEHTAPAHRLGANDHYLTIESDPSQESAVAVARLAPGLLLEGPPGTGKSQTIVNIVADCIGRNESVLVVCQKQAALRVVEKRLQAEGLSARVTSVVDAVRDRESIVKGIREQLDALRLNHPGRNTALTRGRETIAARVAAHESELDQHHRALYAVDDNTGLSYRDILSSLIRIERNAISISAPGLRARFESLERWRIAQLEQVCGPLARLWLASKYEGSPLAVLKNFAADSATIELLSTALQVFADGEAGRALNLGRPAPSFEVLDPILYRQWFARIGTRLADMPPIERSDLSAWIDDFDPARTDQGDVGNAAIARLDSIVGAISRITAASDRALIENLATIPIGDVRSFATLAVQATNEASFWGKLSLGRFVARRRYFQFLKKRGFDSSDAVQRAVLNALGLEIQLRPLRKGLQTVLASLGLPQQVEGLITPQEIGDSARKSLDALQSAKTAAELVYSCPARRAAVQMVKAGTADAYVAFCREIATAIERYEARQRSLQRLEGLRMWIVDSWIEEQRTVIDSNSYPLTSTGMIQDALISAEAYQRFRSRAGQLDPLALGVFATLRAAEKKLEQVPNGILDQTIRTVIENEALLAWKARIEAAEPVLLLEPDEIESKVVGLSEADSKMRDANRELLAKSVAVSQLGTAKAWEEITRLRGPRALRLREVIGRGSDLGLLAMRPVWLMNPDTTSRILPLRAGMFDTVVFDEASQMLVEHALPSLFRSKRVIICGDEKQMPPTSFFSARPGSDEEGEFDGQDLDETASDIDREKYADTWNRREIKDCPDLLSLGRTFLPQRMLQIHYRSKYRELINYSNAAFYGGRLNVPARHPDSEIRRTRPIEVIRADSVYEAQTNAGEAARIVQVLGDIWAQSTTVPSIGIVTFNKKQADLVEEMIDERAARDSAFLAAFTRERDRVQDGEDMGFFVRNVENVQGDERDVILFSTTFGRDRQGAFRRAFGVLGQFGGERRLNVAVTRAREKVILVTSMPINDVSDMLAVLRPPSTPRDYLQAYLDYASKVSAGELELARNCAGRLGQADRATVANQAQDGFVEAVAAYLAQLGHTTVPVDDGDAFSIDLAIEDPRTGLFGIAIECDSPRDDAGHLASARAREVWRPSMLRRAIPVVHRVSSYGWFHAAEDEKRKLRGALEEALVWDRR